MSNINEVDEPIKEQEAPRYRVIQKGVTTNIQVADFESLVTHHPFDNRNAVIRNGMPMRVENPLTRSYGKIGNELQELETRRTDGGTRSTLSEHQVLLIKDFMLEDSRIARGGPGARDVDVPAPVAGYVGRVHSAQGLVDIYDRQGGEVIARIRHMHPIRVQEGDTIDYGQAVGTQNRRGLAAEAGKHVHLEMDTRYYQQYENYIADLTSGRLSIDTSRQTRGIEPLPVFDDGTFRLGETSPRIRDLQHVLVDQHYLGAHGQPIETDGIYRLSRQPAVLAFQQAHGLPMTGDIDSATLQLAPPPMRREADRPDHDMGREHGFGGPRAPNRDRSDRLDPDHPNHALYESARETTRSLYAQHGITLPDDELARFAPQVSPWTPGAAG